MNYKNFDSTMNLLKCLVIAAAIFLPSTIITVKAQNNLPKVSNPTINGLFFPSASQRFFEAGIKDFEREIDFLHNSEKYFNVNILEIDEELIEQIEDKEVLNYLKEKHNYFLDETNLN